MSKRNNGFTLIEIMVVIAIIGILASLVIVAIRKVRIDAQNTRIQSDVRQLRILAEAAYDTNGANYYNWSTQPVVAADVLSLLEDIDAAGGDSPGAPYFATIRDNQTKNFCISAPLHVSTGNFVCVDATGAFSVTSSPCAEQPDDGDPLRCATP